MQAKLACACVRRIRYQRRTTVETTGDRRCRRRRCRRRV